MESIKFLHLSDVHLDRPMWGGKLKFSHEKSEQRLRDVRDTFTRALELAESEKVDLIIIAGDLWEEDNLSPDTIPFVMDSLANCGHPVVISPGNHDYYSPSSQYSSDITSARFGKRWSENVHIFKEYDFEHITIPQLDGLCITGLAYQSNQSVSIRRFGEEIQVPDADLHLAVIHGSRDSHLPRGKMMTLPFSDLEILDQPFDYTALGHYHHLATIQDDNKIVRAAYPGSLCALSVSEKGHHGVLIGELTAGGVKPDKLQFHELDRRRIIRFNLDISGLGHTQAVEKKIVESLAVAEARPQDIVHVNLKGTYTTGSRIPLSEQLGDELCYHIQVNTSEVRPEWSLDDDPSLNPNTTEAIYRNKLRELIEKAIADDDQDRLAMLQNVLYYGLDALSGQEIHPRQSE